MESLDFCVDCLDACVDCLDSCNDCLDVRRALRFLRRVLRFLQGALRFLRRLLRSKKRNLAEEYLRRNFHNEKRRRNTTNPDTRLPAPRALRAGQARLPQVICRWRRRCPCPLPQPVSQRHSIIRLRAHSRPSWQVWRRTAPWRRGATCALKVAGCACSPCAN